jgi:hypothetical protein
VVRVVYDLDYDRGRPYQAESRGVTTIRIDRLESEGADSISKYSSSRNSVLVELARH